MLRRYYYLNEGTKLILSIAKRYKSEERFKMKSKVRKAINSKTKSSLPNPKKLAEMRQNLRNLTLRYLNKVEAKKQPTQRVASK